MARRARLSGQSAPKASPPSGEDEGPPQGGTDAAWPGSFRPNGRATGRQMNEVRGNGGSAPPGEATRRAVPVPESTEPREFCQVDMCVYEFANESSYIQLRERLLAVDSAQTQA